MGAARALVLAAGNARLNPRVTSARRSRAEQTRLYRRSLQGLQAFYVAPPGTSAHEYGWAFDLVVTPWQALSDVGGTWKDWGGGWDRSDPVHFELLGASELARKLGAEQKPASIWDYGGVALSFTSVASMLFELGYVVASEEEALSVMRALHIPIKRRP